jgi:hypothetical protein
MKKPLSFRLQLVNNAINAPKGGLQVEGKKNRLNLRA